MRTTYPNEVPAVGVNWTTIIAPLLGKIYKYMCNFNIFIIYGSTPPLQLQHSPPLSNPQEDDESYDNLPVYRAWAKPQIYTE